MRSDAELIRTFVASQEEGAFACLLERHWGTAQRLAYRCLGDATAAEDVAQETFVRLARLGGSDWELRGPFGSYFRTLVLNAAFDAAKVRGRRRRHEDRFRDRAPLSTASPVDAELEAEEVRQELLRLPDDLRRPLVLRYYEGCSHREVAAELGCPPGTASSRIRRGLEQLRQALEPAYAGVVTTAALATTLALAPAPATAAPAPAAASLLALSEAPRRSSSLVVLIAGACALALALTTWVLGPWGVTSPQIASDTSPSAPPAAPRSPAPSLVLEASDSEKPSGASGGEDEAPPTRPSETDSGPLGRRPKAGPSGPKPKDADDRRPVEIPDLPTLLGSVRDARSGLPIRGAEVACVRDYERDDVASISTTTAAGVFELPIGRYVTLDRDGLASVHGEDQTPVGSFVFVVRAPGYRSFTRSLRTSELAGAPLDALLEPDPQGTAIRAQLLLPGGRAPARGVRVLIRLELSTRQAGGRFASEAVAPAPQPVHGRMIWSLVSDSEGRVELPGVPAGAATLQVAGSQPYVRASAVLSLTTETRVELQTGADLDLIIEGPDLRLSLRRLDSSDAESYFPGKHARRYSIRGLTPGRYRLTGYFNSSLHLVHTLPAFVEDLELLAGSPHQLRVRRVAPEAAASLCVRVLDEEGQPLAGRRVVAARADADRLGLQSSLETDAKGKVRFSNLAPTTYRIRAQGCVQHEAPLRAGEEREITIHPNPARIVESQVLDPSGRPVAGAKVTAGLAQATTDTQGRFRLELQPDDMPGEEEVGEDEVGPGEDEDPGTLELQVSKPGFESLSEPLAALSSRLVLQPGRDLRVSLTLRGGLSEGAAAYLVFFPEGATRALKAGSPERQGATLRFRIPSAPMRPGRLALRVGQAPPLWLDLDATTTRLDLGQRALPRGRSVRGRLSVPSEEIGFYCVSSPDSPWTGKLALPLEVAGDGSFVLSGLPEADVEVVLLVGDAWARVSVGKEDESLSPLRLSEGEAPLPQGLATLGSPRALNRGEATLTFALEGVALGQLLKIVGRMCDKTIEVPESVQHRVVEANFRETPWRKVVETLAAGVRCRVEDRPGGVALVPLSK